mmetsp:Transcript_16033/g.37819  ORF Transcript_16033/g.37819 Transcript_16033/m.37819 type:complete len:373 (-) Transcript_16033:55-1173(-)
MSESCILCCVGSTLCVYLVALYLVGLRDFTRCVAVPCLPLEDGVDIKGIILPSLSLGAGTSSAKPKATGPPPGLVPGKGRIHKFVIVKSFKHDPEAYTQGLLYLGNDTLLESTGSVGRRHPGAPSTHVISTVRRVNLTTGEVIQRTNNNGKDFGEGLSYYKGYLWQLIWRTRKVIQYDPITLQVIRETSMPSSFDYTDGWGLTSSSDGLSQLYPSLDAVPANEDLYITDSGTKLYKVEFDGDKFVTRHTVTIKSFQGKPLEMANELELIGSEVWANVYTKDCIARIDPANGQVIGWILGQDLHRQEAARGGEVFNGIAYDRTNGRLWVTGKLWTRVFEVKLEPVSMSETDVERQCVPTMNVFHRTKSVTRYR